MNIYTTSSHINNSFNEVWNIGYIYCIEVSDFRSLSIRSLIRPWHLLGCLDSVVGPSSVVYMCVIFESMHSILFYLDDVTNAYWKKRGLFILDWYLGARMAMNSAGEKVKKERNDGKWANEQALKTELHISPNWLTPSFFNMHLWRHPGKAKILWLHKYTTIFNLKQLKN